LTRVLLFNKPCGVLTQFTSADVGALDERGSAACAGERAGQRPAPLSGADHDQIVGLHWTS
jgi:hypothetical protein